MSKTKNGTIIASIIAEGLGNKDKTKVVTKGELDTQYSGPTIDINANPTKCEIKENGDTYCRDGKEVVLISPVAMKLMENRRRSKGNRKTKE